jgi:hypothetical protein
MQAGKGFFITLPRSIRGIVSLVMYRARTQLVAVSICPF